MIKDHVAARRAWGPLAPVIWGLMAIYAFFADHSGWPVLVLGLALCTGGMIGLYFSLRWWKNG